MTLQATCRNCMNTGVGIFDGKPCKCPMGQAMASLVTQLAEQQQPAQTAIVAYPPITQLREANGIGEGWQESDHPVALWLRNKTRNKTTEQYWREVKRFHEWLWVIREKADLFAVDFADVLAYREWLSDPNYPTGPLRSSTIVARLAILSSLYGHLASRGVIASNPLLPLDFPEITDTKFKRAWRIDEIIAFMQAIPQAPRGSVATLQAARDRALFWLLFRNGLRVSEAVGARVGDLEEMDGAHVLVIREHGRDDQHVKRGKQRLAVLKPETWAVIESYVALRGLEEGAVAMTMMLGEDWRDWPLFPSTRRTGRRPRPIGGYSPTTLLPPYALDRRTVLHLMQQYGMKAGIDPDILHPHAARMTAITHLILAGVDIGSVMTYSGHQSMASVQRYFDSVQQVKDNAAWRMPY